MRRGLLPGAALAACAALAPVPAEAQDCRIALSLAIDVSSSVDAADYALQAGGLIAALTAPEVVDAFLAVPGISVALHVYEWSGRWQQVVMLDWLIVSTRDDLVEAAARLAALPRSHDDFPTALGAGIGFGAQRLAEAPACRRKVLDVSGDGINNEAFGPASARRAFPFEGVTVNGLVIGAEREALATHYRAEVIQGSGAFVEEAVDFADFERAMRRKLVRELRPLELSATDGR